MTVAYTKVLGRCRNMRAGEQCRVFYRRLDVSPTYLYFILCQEPQYSVAQVHVILSCCMSHHGSVDASEPEETTLASNCSPPRGSDSQGAEILDGRQRSSYSVTALELLVEAAEQYKANGEPVTWGWCK